MFTRIYVTFSRLLIEGVIHRKGILTCALFISQAQALKAPYFSPLLTSVVEGSDV